MAMRNLSKNLTFGSILLFSLQGCAQKHTELKHLTKPFIPTAPSLSSTHSTPASSTNSYTEVSVLKEVAPHINTHVLALALQAYDKAKKQGLARKPILSVIDYSLPDTEKRLWIFDLHTNRLLYHTLVAHGRNSGDVRATRFSNTGSSKESSLGLYLTANTYYGRDGYSLRLKGLSHGFNSSAFNRAVVMHGAAYVSESFVRQNHRLGRSWGCPAINKQLARPVIDTVKNGTLIFAYANDRRWLNNGPYVTRTYSL